MGETVNTEDAMLDLLDTVFNATSSLFPNGTDNTTALTACQSLYFLYTQPWIWLAFSLQAIICPAAIVFNILVIVLLIKSDLVTINLKLVLINLGVWCTVAALYLFSRIVAYFVYHVLSQDCAIQLWRWGCRGQELVLLFCLAQIVLSIGVIALERLVALCRFTNDVDKMLKDSVVGQVLVGIIWTVSVAACIITVLSIDDEQVEPLVLCNMLLSAQLWRSRIVLLVALCIELLFLLVYLLALCVTRAKCNGDKEILTDSAEPYSLSKRFAHKRNSEVHMMLLPVTLNQFLFCTCICGGSVLLLFFGLSLPVHYQVLALEYIVRVLCALMIALHPFLVLWNSYALRREAEKCCPCLFHGLFPPCPSSDPGMSPHELKTSQPHSAGSTNKADTHFDILNTMWSAEPKGSESRNPLLEPSTSPSHTSSADARLTGVDVSTFQTIDEGREAADPYSSIKKTAQSQSYTSHYTYSSSGTSQPDGSQHQPPEPPPHLIHPVIYEDPHEEHIDLHTHGQPMESTPLVLQDSGVHEGVMTHSYTSTSSSTRHTPAASDAYKDVTYSSYKASHTPAAQDSYSSQKWSSMTRDPIMSYSYTSSSSAKPYSSDVPASTTYQTYSNLDNEESEYIKAIRNKYRMPPYTPEKKSDDDDDATWEARSKIEERRANFFSSTDTS